MQVFHPLCRMHYADCRIVSQIWSHMIIQQLQRYLQFHPQNASNALVNLSRTTMVVDTHIVSQTAVHVIDLFNMLYKVWYTTYRLFHFETCMCNETIRVALRSAETAL